MATQTKPEGTAKAVETKNEALHLVVAPADKPSNFGRFAYQVSCKLTFDQLIQRAAEGLLHVAQRGPASRVEKTIVGYAKRPENFERSSIAYSDTVARQFEAEMAKEIEKEIHLKVSVTASEYEPKARDVAYAEAKKMVKYAVETKRFSNLVNKAGFKGSVKAETALDNVEFLQAVEAFRKQLIERAF